MCTLHYLAILMGSLVSVRNIKCLICIIQYRGLCHFFNCASLSLIKLQRFFCSYINVDGIFYMHMCSCILGSLLYFS